MKDDIEMSCYLHPPQFILLKYELEHERLNCHGDKVVIITKHDQISSLIAN